VTLYFLIQNVVWYVLPVLLLCSTWYNYLNRYEAVLSIFSQNFSNTFESGSERSWDASDENTNQTGSLFRIRTWVLSIV